MWVGGCVTTNYGNDVDEDDAMMIMIKRMMLMRRKRKMAKINTEKIIKNDF